MISTEFKADISLTSFRSLLIQWDFEVNQHSVVYLNQFKEYLKVQDEEILYLTSAFNSILVNYHFEIDFNTKKDLIYNLLSTFKLNDEFISKSKTYRIPVCYQNFGLDLENISYHLDYSISEIIDFHTSKTYTLFFTGFLPGFLYLGKVDDKINLPRHKKPRPKVKAGSVGIAENQTGIYPMESPGGWQIIGRTPLKIFDVNHPKPSPFNPGDQINFYEIDKSKFMELNENDTNSLFKNL